MTQELATLLTGHHVRLWPYAAALFPRDTLYQVWRAIEEEHGWPRIFWWQDAADAQKGDLVAFAEYMRDKTPVLVQKRDTDKLCGLIWFDAGVQGLRTSISIWYRRAAWGAHAHEATALATRYAHQCLGYRQVWGVTPWKAAMHHGLRCGYKFMCTFPRYVLVNNKPMPLHFICHEA